MIKFISICTKHISVLLIISFSFASISCSSSNSEYLNANKDPYPDKVLSSKNMVTNKLYLKIVSPPTYEKPILKFKVYNTPIYSYNTLVLQNQISKTKSYKTEDDNFWTYFAVFTTLLGLSSIPFLFEKMNSPQDNSDNTSEKIAYASNILLCFAIAAKGYWHITQSPNNRKLSVLPGTKIEEIGELNLLKHKQITMSVNNQSINMETDSVGVLNVDMVKDLKISYSDEPQIIGFNLNYENGKPYEFNLSNLDWMKPVFINQVDNAELLSSRQDSSKVIDKIQYLEEIYVDDYVMYTLDTEWVHCRSKDNQLGWMRSSNGKVVFKATNNSNY